MWGKLPCYPSLSFMQWYLRDDLIIIFKIENDYFKLTRDNFLIAYKEFVNGKVPWDGKIAQQLRGLIAVTKD